MNSIQSIDNASIAQVTISLAFSGNLAQIFQNSDICKNCRVQDLNEVPTDILLPLLNESSLVLSVLTLYLSFIFFGRLSNATLILSLNISSALSLSCAIIPTLTLSFLSA
jgi:hypothetical protein